MDKFSQNPEGETKQNSNSCKEEEQLMSKRLIIVFGASILLLSLALVSAGQVRRVTTIQNPDGTYTIVEYPIGRETVVNLSPIGLTAARGRATILRDPSGTTIRLSLTNLPPS